jgi:hypothetical protein
VAESTSQPQAWCVDYVIWIATRLWDCRWRGLHVANHSGVLSPSDRSLCTTVLRRYLLALATRIKYEFQISV